MAYARSLIVSGSGGPCLGVMAGMPGSLCAGRSAAALRVAGARARGGGEDKGRRFALAGTDQSPLSQAIRARGRVAVRDMA